MIIFKLIEIIEKHFFLVLKKMEGNGMYGFTKMLKIKKTDF